MRRAIAVQEAMGQACPAYVFANYGDEGYGRFLLDPVSEAAMRPVVPDGDALLHSMLWGALWENVRLAQTAPRGFVELALANLPKDEQGDEALVRVQGARLATALHSYMPAAMREELAPRVEEELAKEMVENPKLDLRIVNFRAFTVDCGDAEGIGEGEGVAGGEADDSGDAVEAAGSMEPGGAFDCDEGCGCGSAVCGGEEARPERRGAEVCVCGGGGEAIRPR